MDVLENYNILITVNLRYIKYFTALLRSLDKNTAGNFTVYVISKDVTEDDLLAVKEKLYDGNKFTFQIISVPEDFIKDAPVSKKYPDTIYYRLFAGELLPETLDRVLYLDTDIIVLKDIKELYSTDFGDKIFMGATHTKEMLRKFNEIKNKAKRGSPYLNTGVLLINLKLLREYHDSGKIFEYIQKNYFSLFLPDQDVLQGLYGDKLGVLDSGRYNLSDRYITEYNLGHKDKIDLSWVENNCTIVHYLGKNKPWKKNYKGILDKYYKEYCDVETASD